MSQGLQLARPVMRRSAGLDPDQARRQLLEERQNAAPPQLTADNHLALRINAMDLKHRLGDVETDSRNRLHVGSSETGPSKTPTFMALACRWRSRPQHQERTLILLKIYCGY